MVIGLLAAVASAQGGVPHRTTLVDCLVATPFEGELTPVQRVSVLLPIRGAENQSGSYRVKGVTSLGGGSSVRIDQRWPHSFTIDEYASLSGIHQGAIGSANSSLHIERINERQGLAELTLVEHADYAGGGTAHRAVTGTCRLTSGPAAARSFEEITE